MSTKKPKFEEALKKLEKIVSKLEGGELAIEESLKLFEEGVKLSRIANNVLEDAEKKIEMLVKGENGVKIEPFDTEEG